MELRVRRAYKDNLAGSSGQHIAQGNPAFRLIHSASIYDVCQSVRLQRRADQLMMLFAVIFGDIVNPFYQRVGAGANEVKTCAGSYAGMFETADHPNKAIRARLAIKLLSKQDR
jgi:hypothetical protein